MVVEHDMQFVGALCEDVIVLDFGRKIAQGRPRRSAATPRCRRPISARRSLRSWSVTVQLELHDLSIRYGRVHAVRGVSLSLAEGEMVAVLGANGAGKSSLLRAVLGMVRIAGGRVMFDGRDFTR